MKLVISRTLFWLSWPLIWLYAPLTKRARMLIVKDDTFLAVMPFFGSGVWQLPGGGIKHGERAIDAASREVQEEVGLKIADVVQLIELKTYTEAGIRLRYELFVSDVSSQPTPIALSSEIHDFAWLPLSGEQNLASHVTEAINTHKR